MSGAFDDPIVAVQDTVDAGTFPSGAVPLWIRGRDAAGAWGPADSMSVYVNQGTSSLVPIGGATPTFTLEQSVPNPFAREATIRFSLARSGPAELSIYDVGGRRVRRLVARALPAGHYEIRWDGRDANGRPAASGVYFCRLESNDRRVARRVVLMK
jgi:hypothetical protein